MIGQLRKVLPEFANTTSRRTNLVPLSFKPSLRNELSLLIARSSNRDERCRVSFRSLHGSGMPRTSQDGREVSSRVGRRIRRVWRGKELVESLRSQKGRRKGAQREENRKPTMNVVMSVQHADRMPSSVKRDMSDEPARQEYRRKTSRPRGRTDELSQTIWRDPYRTEGPTGRHPHRLGLR